MISCEAYIAYQFLSFSINLIMIFLYILRWFQIYKCSDARMKDYKKTLQNYLIINIIIILLEIIHLITRINLIVDYQKFFWVQVGQTITSIIQQILQYIILKMETNKKQEINSFHYYFWIIQISLCFICSIITIFDSHNYQEDNFLQYMLCVLIYSFLKIFIFLVLLIYTKKKQKKQSTQVYPLLGQPSLSLQFLKKSLVYEESNLKISLKVKQKIKEKYNPITKQNEIYFDIIVQTQDQNIQNQQKVQKSLQELIDLENNLKFYPSYGDPIINPSSPEILDQISNFLNKIMKNRLLQDQDVFSFFMIPQEYKKIFTCQDQNQSLFTSSSKIQNNRFNYFPYFYVFITDQICSEQAVKYQIIIYPQDNRSIQYRIVKRYSCFVDIHEHLKTKFKESILPKLPPKNIISYDVQIRKKLLQDYLQILFNTEIFLNRDLYSQFGLNQLQTPEYNFINFQNYKGIITQINKKINQEQRQFTSYNINIRSENLNIQIEKRYKQFDELHKQLERLGFNMPKLPQKYFKNKVEKQEERQQGLQKFLNELFKIPNIDQQFYFRKFIFEDYITAEFYDNIESVRTEYQSQNHQQSQKYVNDSYNDQDTFSLEKINLESIGNNTMLNSVPFRKS